jgi:glucan phosphoethanolaminetransferase (alkaline phosphatase superfamily)
MTKYPEAQSIAQTTTRFLSFFTIHTNILIAVCMLLPALILNSRTSHLLSKPSLRTAVMSYSALAGIIYFLLLRNIGHDDGLERRADQILHYVTPAMFLIDWLLSVPRGRYPSGQCQPTCSI